MNPSVYTVTPPDFKLIANGPIVMLLGIRHANCNEIVDLIDSVIYDDAVIYVSDEDVTQNNVGWYRAATESASIVIVDVASATSPELLMAAHAETSYNKTVLWFDSTGENQTVCQLVNSYQSRVFVSFDNFRYFFEENYPFS
jgi:hypothetical protein